MISCILIVMNLFLLMGGLTASSTITRGPDNLKALSPTNGDFARSKAADTDMRFFSAFLSDFKKNQNSYNSYLDDHQKTMPQKVADYYQHVAQLPQSANLEKDVAASFPFFTISNFYRRIPMV